MSASLDMAEGRQVFGWTLAAFGPSFQIGVEYAFGPVYCYPAVRYVWTREFHGKTFKTTVLIGPEVPDAAAYEMIVDHLLAADEALDKMLEWPV